MFPPYGAVAFDEAHKLLNAARQMYGQIFDSAELERLSGSLLRAIGGQNPDKLAIIHGCEELLRQNAVLYDKMILRMEEKAMKIAGLLDCSQHIYWLELTGALSCRICTLPKQLDFLLYEDIWSKETAYILTSGTLSVGGDFSPASTLPGTSCASGFKTGAYFA